MATKRRAALPVPLEHAEQVAVCDWWKLACNVYKIPEKLLYAIPNAGKRSPAAAAWYRAEGLRTSMLDLCLAVARGEYHGLYIEMKRITGDGATDGQEQTIADLRAQGYAATVCNGSAAAIATIDSYLRGRLA